MIQVIKIKIETKLSEDELYGRLKGLLKLDYKEIKLINLSVSGKNKNVSN